MTRLGSLTLFLLIFSGCAAPASEPTFSPSPSPRLFAVVAPGEALVLRLSPGDGETFSFDTNGAYDFGIAGPRLADSYMCAAVLIPEGWQPGASRRFVGPFVARRDEGRHFFAGESIGSVAGEYGPGFTGRTETFVLVAHDASGPSLNSTLKARTSHGTFQPITSGQAWCLDGPGAFLEGDYFATPQSLDAASLAWRESFEHGLILRLESNADVAGLRLEGPEGTHALPSGLWRDGATDATFCSPTGGDWSLHIDAATARKGWTLRAFVMDAALPGLSCPTAWTESFAH